MTVAAPLPDAVTDDSQHDLKHELELLFQTMEQVRHEIALIRHPLASQDRLKTMAEQLDAIVPATEEAANRILSAAEVSEKLDLIGVNIADLFQACSFQDITGQWIKRITGSLKHIDERITALVDLWGRDDIAHVPIEETEEEADAEKKLMSGPQIDGGTSQDDIDKLFD